MSYVCLNLGKIQTINADATKNKLGIKLQTRQSMVHSVYFHISSYVLKNMSLSHQMTSMHQGILIIHKQYKKKSCYIIHEKTH